MNLYLSRKLRIASFLLIILIVILHGYNLVINYQPGPFYALDNFNFLLQNFISDGICRIAVPLFFIISGYLYFINIQENYNSNYYFSKLRRRIHSVLIPFLIWSMMGAILLFMLLMIPVSEVYFYKYNIRNFEFPHLLDLWLLNPINYQLWFLQVLFLLSLISPLVYLVAKWGKYVLPLFVPLLFVNFPVGFLGSVAIEGFIFFSFGAFLAVHQIKIQMLLSKKLLILLLMLWFFLIGFKIYLATINYHTLSENFEKLSMIPGILFFWFGMDYIYNYLKMVDLKIPIFSFSFFIFLFHEPTLIIIKKLLLMQFGVNPMGNFVTYVLAPLLTITLAIVIGMVLKKWLPRVYFFLTGSR